MKDFLLLFFMLTSQSLFADQCTGAGNTYSDLSCTKGALDQSKAELNVVYNRIYLSTAFKREFEQAQKQWLSYRAKQCDAYLGAEASQSQGVGSALIVKECLAVLTKQRVDYLKTLAPQ